MKALARGGALALLVASALLSACAQTALPATPSPAAVQPVAVAISPSPPVSEATPAPPTEAACVTEAELASGQADTAKLRGLDSFCLEMQSGETLVIDQKKALANVRAFAGSPALALTLEGIGTSLNAPQPLRVAVFHDDQNSEYRVETTGWRVVEARLQAPRAVSNELPLAELRAKAEQIIAENTPGFDGMRDRLYYEEGSKLTTYFFRWEDRGTQGWQGMPPMAQVGIEADGRLVTYVNSLFVAGQ